MLNKLSGVAFKYLKDEHFDALRDAYLVARTKMYPVMRAVYGTFDSSDLRVHLEQQIGTDHEVLMVHISINHLMPMYTGDPLGLVNMLMDYCGDSRTLVMPAFYFGDPEIGGVIETFQQNPHFDSRRTPSQMGLATELFRRSRGVLQSRHPVYRVSAYGPLAEELTRGHESARTPSGIGTPFDFMANHDTQIIGIGKTIEVLTQVHHAEDIMGDAFPVPRKTGEDIEVFLRDRVEEVQLTLERSGLLWQRDMSKLRDIMAKEVLQEWSFHRVPFFATRAADVTDALVKAAKQGVTLYKPE